MHTVIMTSETFEGQITFQFSEAGRLELLQIEAALTAKQQQWLGANIPWNIDQVNQLKDSTKKATFIVQDREVTFDMFWNRYNDKSRSSKVKTEKAWDKLSKTDQFKAYYYIPVYLKNKGHADQKYATTYLSDQLWNN